MLVDVDIAWPDDELCRGSLRCACPALRHRPVMATLAIERDVQGAKIVRIATSALASQSVIGREDATDEGNNGQAISFVVT